MRNARSGRCGVVFRALAMGALVGVLTGSAWGDPDVLPKPRAEAPAADRPVQVYILSGQSNMVGMGDVSGGGSRWGAEFREPVVSVYAGAYDPELDYDAMTPIKTLALDAFGGTRPTPYPGGGVQVVRGTVVMKETGVYEFRPGYGGSMQNLMEVKGVEVHRLEPGGQATRTLITLKAGEAVPFKITYLGAQANGLGWWARTDIPGTLTTLVKQEGKFPHLLDAEGRWSVRNDVTYKGVVSAVGQGALTVGLQGNTIGPELQFGHVLGNHHDAPVLIIKSSIGNRSLGWDILPPGSERYTFDGRVYAGYKDSPASWAVDTKPKPINWYAGKTYDRYTASIHEVLDQFGALFPAYQEQGYEIAGFAWWQGHKDGGSEAHIRHYETNLVNLIKAWRKEFDAPNAPWVIATVGFEGDKMPENYVRILKAQLGAADPERHPELAGTVRTVDTRPYWKGIDVSPKDQNYHYHRNAETYLRVGGALGRAMVDLRTNE